MLLAVFCLAVVVLVLCCLPVLSLYLFAVSHGVLVFCLPGVVLSHFVAASKDQRY